MSVIKTGSIVAALAIAGVLIAAATRSDTFRVQRSASNPFEQQDPNLKGSYSGAASGKSAAYTFAGNGNVGKGTIEIIESAPASRMQGPVPYLAKIIHLFIDMDRMVGSEFEAGLASLKAIAEKTP